MVDRAALTWKLAGGGELRGCCMRLRKPWTSSFRFSFSSHQLPEQARDLCEHGPSLRCACTMVAAMAGPLQLRQWFLHSIPPPQPP